MENKYTKEELKQLEKIIGPRYDNQAHILFKLPPLQGNCIYFIEEPLENMPLYINERGAYKHIALWRLLIGK